MRKTIYFILLFFLAFASCSKDERENRLTEKSDILPVDTTAKDSTSFWKKVLIEDFTGQRCINCPDATVAIKAVVGSQHNRIIPVGIHGGGYGQNTPLANALGAFSSYCYNLWGIASQPSVMVNRHSDKMLSNVNTMQAELYSQVMTEAVKTTPVGFDRFEAVPTPDTDKYTVSMTIKSFEDIQSAQLQLWVLEDAINSYQYYSDGRHTDYIHGHVLRATITPNEGETISLTQTEPLTKTFTYTHSAAWNISNVSLVAIISTPSQGVLQVEKIKLQK